MLYIFYSAKAVFKVWNHMNFETDNNAHDQLIYIRQLTSLKIIKHNFVMYLQNPLITLEATWIH